ncbi:GntR family transcriptional regulator [Bacillus sp. B-jedd]|uniref:GntR family transcriptional regulator n=1 Tax=Bacillus sp. B-jedd TaxID=1476857 RepID=UPI0005156E80|nr:GntR family transcriptional regulator [Bacillus sp. B-jedd]CEG29399.1 GntR family transcriptional regulator [Bacillus sp. B-jedd]
MEINSSNIQRVKKPLYIDVYDKLYKKIMDGTFPNGSKLPTEAELAKMFGVSRMTLRQALSLLQDDGLVKSFHGKGSFITKSPSSQKAIGLEKIGHPIYKCHTEKIDEVNVSFRLDLESDYTQQVLGRRAAAVVAFERFYKSNGKAVAYAFSFMAIETVSELNFDLQDEKQVMEMLENKVYELANSATIEIKRSNVAEPLSQNDETFGGAEFDVLLESVYINKQYPVIYNKYYIPKEFSVIKINADK